ncbi:MAG: hypothetical protein ACRDHX_09825 [Chloroflexota bacterium]
MLIGNFQLAVLVANLLSSFNDFLLQLVARTAKRVFCLHALDELPQLTAE